MHTAVDFLLRQCNFELVSEKPFRSNLAERLVETLVASCLERDDVACNTARFQCELDNTCLAQSELGCSRSDSNDAICHLKTRSIAATRPSVVASSASISSSIPAAFI